jgi:hypothetical protein
MAIRSNIGRLIVASYSRPALLLLLFRVPLATTVEGFLSSRRRLNCQCHEVREATNTTILEKPRGVVGAQM